MLGDRFNKVPITHPTEFRHRQHALIDRAERRRRFGFAAIVFGSRGVGAATFQAFVLDGFTASTPMASSLAWKAFSRTWASSVGKPGRVRTRLTVPRRSSLAS